MRDIEHIYNQEETDDTSVISIASGKSTLSAAFAFNDIHSVASNFQLNLADVRVERPTEQISTITSSSIS